MAGKGAPLGNTNASLDKRIWANAIRRAVSQKDGAKLRSLAERLIARAEEGDVSALKELGDRLDGRPSQIVEGTGEHGEHLFRWLE